MSVLFFTRQNLIYQLPGALDLFGNPVPDQFSLFLNLVQDLVIGGFEILPGSAGMNGGTLQTSTKVILRPTVAVDPLATTDPWHILIAVEGSAEMPNPLYGQAGQTNAPPTVSVANTGLYMSIGSVADLTSVSNYNTSLFKFWVVPPRFYTLTPTQTTVVGLTVNAPRLSATAPMEYSLTTSDRGFALTVYNTAITEDFTQAGMICIQRGVSCDGTVNVSGTKPLYMVTNVSPLNVQGPAYAEPGPKNEWYYSIIRQASIDTMDPTFTIFGDFVSTPGGERLTTSTLSDNRDLFGAAINYFPTRWFTPVTNDTNEFLMIFPFGLGSSRYIHNDEIDLIAVSKADAYQAGQNAPITVYGQDRTYTAFSSNNDRISNNSGVRYFQLSFAND